MRAIEHHEFRSVTIDQRLTDGYLNATEMCKAAGKRLNNYLRNETTMAFVDALSTETRIRASKLIQSVKGGKGPQGTWVHPKVAIHLAQWLSPEFAVWCTNIIYNWMQGRSDPKELAAKAEHQRQNKIRFWRGRLLEAREQLEGLGAATDVLPPRRRARNDAALIEVGDVTALVDTKDYELDSSSLYALIDPITGRIVIERVNMEHSAGLPLNKRLAMV